jgi:hypothetical protein
LQGGDRRRGQRGRPRESLEITTFGRTSGRTGKLWTGFGANHGQSETNDSYSHSRPVRDKEKLDLACASAQARGLSLTQRQPLPAGDSASLRRQGARKAWIHHPAATTSHIKLTRTHGLTATRSSSANSLPAQPASTYRRSWVFGTNQIIAAAAARIATRAASFLSTATPSLLAIWGITVGQVTALD